MKFEFEITLQDLAFAYCLLIWAWFFTLATAHLNILPFNQGLLYIYTISLVASIPGVPAYLIWKWKKKKREGIKE